MGSDLMILILGLGLLCLYIWYSSYSRRRKQITNTSGGGPGHALVRRGQGGDSSGRDIVDQYHSAPAIRPPAVFCPWDCNWLVDSQAIREAAKLDHKSRVK